jgi:hypothetical protein
MKAPDGPQTTNPMPKKKRRKKEKNARPEQDRADAAYRKGEYNADVVWTHRSRAIWQSSSSHVSTEQGTDMSCWTEARGDRTTTNRGRLHVRMDV